MRVVEIRFEVLKIIHRDKETGYTIIKAKYTNSKSSLIPTSDIVILGNFFSIQEEDEFVGEGYWAEDGISGRQFKLNWNKLITPVSRKGMKKFLLKYVKGIGVKSAEAIVDFYREDTFDKIREDWNNLIVISGIGEKKAKLIHYKMCEHQKFDRIAMFLMQYGASYMSCINIYEQMGNNCVQQIRENPYLLCDIKKVGFIAADNIAKNMKFDLNSQLRLKAAILYYIDFLMKQQGHLYIERVLLVNEVTELLSESSIPPSEINRAIDELTIDRKIVVEINENNEQCVYLSHYNRIENSIVKKIETLVREVRKPTVSTSQVTDFISKYQIGNKMQFGENQKQAIYMAMKNRISILTGGPGTGKTQTINSIIKCLQHYNPATTIELAAPTGKAAKRMTELTKLEAKTIHRIINLTTNEEYEETQMINVDYLIVDESSMIDAYVFNKLICSVSDDTRLLLVGDFEQLPSIGPGLVLRDLINSKKIPTTKLDDIFRQAKESQIITNSHKLINGRNTTGNDPIIFNESKGGFYFIDESDTLDIQRYLLKTIEKLIENNGKTLADIQVLTPMNKGELGVIDLNNMIQSQFNPKSSTKEEIKMSETSILRVGDRVIQTVNNYNLNIFNGEVGVIKSIRNENNELALTVDFEEKEIVYNNRSIDELMLSYAMTVHKSQGSEFPIVLMPIHEAHDNMLNRNLIYTAWTRAKETIICFGTNKALDKAIENTDNLNRNSRIKEKIQINL